MKSKIIGKKQLLALSLAGALGLTVFVNWYYTNPQSKLSSEPEVTTEAPLGQAQYVNGTAVSQEGDYFTAARLNRTKAHDSAKEQLQSVINDSTADEETKTQARSGLTKLSNTIKTEADCENLIKARTGLESLVTVSEKTAEAILPAGSINDDVALKVKEILISKTELSADAVTLIELSADK